MWMKEQSFLESEQYETSLAGRRKRCEPGGQMDGYADWNATKRILSLIISLDLEENPLVLLIIRTMEADVLKEWLQKALIEFKK